MNKTLLILSLLIGSISCFGQFNLNFEKWNIDYQGIDAAKHWVNTSDATKYQAPTTLFKEVDNPASGLASIKLTTAYWEDGAPYDLDTLVGSLLQQVSYSQRPESFEFSFKSDPVEGDEILVGVQLTLSQDDSTIVIGEGFFTSGETEEAWVNKKVAIQYYSDLKPGNMNIIALSSANAVIINGENGYPKIGSTLYLDNLKLNVVEKGKLENEYFIHVFPNPAKEYINIKTNSPDNQQIEIYNLDGKLLLTDSFIQQSKIDISTLPSGTYIYKVIAKPSGSVTASNRFNVVR